MKKQEYINLAYNISHSIIIWIIIADICTAIGKDFPRYELPIFFSLIGLFVGLGLGAIWEYGVEENLLRMPSSKGDLINMTVCGVIAGFSCAYIEYNCTFLWISSIISALFVIWYIVKMHQTKHLRTKINY